MSEKRHRVDIDLSNDIALEAHGRRQLLPWDLYATCMSFLPIEDVASVWLLSKSTCHSTARFLKGMKVLHCQVPDRALLSKTLWFPLRLVATYCESLSILRVYGRDADDFKSVIKMPNPLPMIVKKCQRSLTFCATASFMDPQVAVALVNCQKLVSFSFLKAFGKHWLLTFKDLIIAGHFPQLKHLSLLCYDDNKKDDVQLSQIESLSILRYGPPLAHIALPGSTSIFHEMTTCDRLSALTHLNTVFNNNLMSGEGVATMNALAALLHKLPHLCKLYLWFSVSQKCSGAMDYSKMIPWEFPALTSLCLRGMGLRGRLHDLPVPRIKAPLLETLQVHDCCDHQRVVALCLGHSTLRSISVRFVSGSIFVDVPGNARRLKAEASLTQALEKNTWPKLQHLQWNYQLDYVDEMHAKRARSYDQLHKAMHNTRLNR
jgi:hypothetical protein